MDEKTGDKESMKLTERAEIKLTAAVAALFALSLALFSGANSAAAENSGNFPVQFSEMLTSNHSYPNADGLCCDYIELYNSSDSPVDLTGYGLTDSDRTVKYIFPSGSVVAGGGYLVVYCSADASAENYAKLGLSKAGGETVRLVDRYGEVQDEAVTIAAPEDVPLVRGSDGTWSLGEYATPGYPNTKDGFTEWSLANGGDSPLCFSEALTSNSLYRGSTGLFSDYLELYNSSSEAIQLEGYSIADADGRILYTFPPSAISGEGYFVLWCEENAETEDCAPFGISRSGETFRLLSPAGAELDTIEIGEMNSNHAWALEDGDWTEHAYATPGYSNDQEGYEAMRAALGYTKCPVRITELMPVNGATIPDVNGSFTDWVELTNSGDESWNLEDYWLSTGTDGLKTRLEPLTLAPGESAVIFCSGLSKHGGTVTLSDPLGNELDSVSYGETASNKSISLDAVSGEWSEKSASTPSFPNTEEGWEDFMKSRVSEGPIVINELMSKNDSCLPYSAGVYYDWVELRNISDEWVTLSGYTLTDDADERDRYCLPDVTLAPGAVFCVWLTGDDGLADSDSSCAGFALASGGDSLILFDSSGMPADYTPVEELPDGCSYGRLSSGVFGVFSKPTPGSSNGEGYISVCPEPEFSAAGGIYNDVDAVDVSLIGPGTIYYTLNGDVPTVSSSVYSEPLHLEKTTVIRAICVSSGWLTSEIATESYIINENHTLPVVSLVSAPAGLFSDETGIYVEGNHRNYYQNWERAGSVALYEHEGEGASFSIDCGIAMFGASSRETCDKKSLKLLFKSRYEGHLMYDVFGDGQVAEYSSLVLRAGQDYNAAIIRDELAGTLAMQTGDSVLVQNMRYVILYINGEYWGIYAIREQYTDDYYAAHRFVTPESVTVTVSPTLNGSMYNLLKTVSGLDTSTSEGLKYISDRVDLDSLTDWMILQAYTHNNDIYGNLRYIRSTEGDGLWRLCFYDQDLGFYSGASFSAVLDSSQQHSILPRAVLKNEAYRERFLLRLSELCSTVLARENVISVLEGLAEELRPEVERDHVRWGLSVSGWEQNIAYLRRQIEGHDRCGELIASISNELGLSEAEREKYFGS